MSQRILFYASTAILWLSDPTFSFIPSRRYHSPLASLPAGHLALQADDDIESEIKHGLSRRELLTWAPILAAALSSSPAFGPADVASAAVDSDVSTKAAFATGKQQIPFSSTRQYKSIKLGNDLRVLLVSDRRAVRAAVALGIAGAGQFSDPKELPGCAHLMEHMVLSATPKTPLRKTLDFEDYLADLEGASNAFTGYEEVVFHFTSPPGVIQEALARFAGLFNEPDILKVCQNEEVLKREIRRVSSELDFDNESMQTFYLMKDRMNPEHPYSKFARGNTDTLSSEPKEAGINVGETLFKFYREHYQSTSTALVVIAPYDFSSLERWVLPFSSILSRERQQAMPTRVFPSVALKADKKMRQVLLYRPKIGSPQRENVETMSLHWALDLNYNDPTRVGRSVVTAPPIGFVLSQILGRRGPGSLYYVLSRRGYLARGQQGVPRITFPVDVSGFQLMKLDICLTLEGFANRAGVVEYIFRAVNSVFSGPALTKFLVSRQILSQYAVVAQLHGYVLAPRPPDAVELAVDKVMNQEVQKSDSPSEWNRFPLPNDKPELFALQKSVREVLLKMSDPLNAVIITTASDKALAKAKQGFMDTVPSIQPVRWRPAPLTGAKFCRDDDILRLTGFVGDLFTANSEEDELLAPLTNNLIPPILRPSRSQISQVIDVNSGRSENWRILEAGSKTIGLRIPRIAPEPSCRCVFVFQLLSPRPARAKTRQAAYAELWKESFEKAIVDLAELGVNGGLAYEVSFNKYGMRLCFLGLSQNIASYSRRFCRRLVQHHKDLLSGGEMLDKSVVEAARFNAMRAPGLSALRKREVDKVLTTTTAYEAATEAVAFFKSVRGGCAFSQGDLLPAETSALFNDLQTIFRDDLGSLGKKEGSTFMPSIDDDLLYAPTWKPRFASSCNVPGIQLLSDACGRVPR